LPVFFWCQAQLASHRASGAAGPLVVGISAPQGCGKSTLCEQLEALFACTGAAAASVSIDDFYLTHADQAALAAAHAGNPLLQMRGNAGSHDVALGAATLRALRAAGAADAPVPLPRYDKSAHEGQGDRSAAAAWPQVRGPLEVVLLEGWMLGFAPVGAAAAAAVHPSLPPVDAALGAYREAWDSQVGSWLVVRVGDPGWAQAWRLQAERAQRASGRPAMSDAQVAAFVDRFMPAYRCYLPGLYARGPTTAAAGRVLVVEVDAGREPVAAQPAAVA
jgi:D-glycerate 3-kinase